jgi:hypothetical protein
MARDGKPPGSQLRFSFPADEADAADSHGLSMVNNPRESAASARSAGKPTPKSKLAAVACDTPSWRLL